MCLQELKAREEMFPYDAIREAGYHAVVFGQRTFNGVGILSRIEPQNVRRGMDDGAEDPQARFLVAQIGEIHVVSAYVPNGQVVGSAHYAYKLDWLRRLRAFLEKHFTPEAPLVLCGDFNVARDELDVADPAAWEESVLYHPTSRSPWKNFFPGDWWMFCVSSIPRVGCTPGGTTGCSPSRRTTACGWITSSPRNLWPADAPAPRSTARNARGRSHPIMRRSSRFLTTGDE